MNDQDHSKTLLTAALRASLLTLVFPALLVLLGCQERPLTLAEIQEQHRFEVGCRAEDAQGYERAMPYCGHGGGGR
jgi:hypothetical protein